MSAEIARMIDELLAAPGAFVAAGNEHRLLEAYFSSAAIDVDIERLRPLLQSDDRWVVQAAVFVASELGAAASPLAPEAVRILEAGDCFAQVCALDMLAMGANSAKASLFVPVVLSLEARDRDIRLQAMDLVARAGQAVLRGAAEAMPSEARHRRGLDLVACCAATDPVNASELTSADALARKYGAIAMLRHDRVAAFAAMASSTDLDLRRFALVYRLAWLPEADSAE